jgi:hypothetical protein
MHYPFHDMSLIPYNTKHTMYFLAVIHEEEGTKIGCSQEYLSQLTLPMHQQIQVFKAAWQAYLNYVKKCEPYSPNGMEI